MKLILLTTPDFFVEEDKILNLLFEEGLDTLHLRKPGTDAVYSERLLTLLPEEYHKKIVIHDHFYLKEEFNLKGIHLNSRNTEIPNGYSGQVSKSIHSMEELKEQKNNFDYVFLSPIYDSISKSNYQAAFDRETLMAGHKEGIIDKNVMALGGITIDHIKEIKDYGFGGVVILGDIWNRFNIHSTKDFKDVVEHFKLLKKAVE